MSTGHLVTTTARATTHHCGQIVLEGISGGLTTTVDPTPLTALGELAALLTGRWTYDLAPSRELHHRDRWRIQRRQPPVLAAHRCGHPPPPPEHIAAAPRTTTTAPATDTPPF